MEMRTLQLLHKLHETAQVDPDVISGSVWEDLFLCVSIEADSRMSLYTRDQILALRHRLRQLQNKIAVAGSASGLSVLTELIGILQAMPDIDRAEQAGFDRAALRHWRRDTVIVLGDSHVNFFSGNETLTVVPIGQGINVCPPADDELPFTALHLGPCLAYTCCQKDTTCRFREKLAFLLKKFICPHAKIMISLGEIDLRVHVLKQATAQKRSCTEIIADILCSYEQLIDDLQKEEHPVLCWGPIATQKDVTPQDPACPRVGTEAERNQATAYFNDELKLLCKKTGAEFFSVFSQMITSDYRTQEKYLSSDRFHLGQSAMQLARPLFAAAGIWREM